ncbi:hypothetical protein Lal_00042712 [Lupinus albus]|nr:hypothetical protein Lal_00042712 [Lupinus albus]
MTSQNEENELASQTLASQKRTPRGVTSMKKVIHARRKNIKQNLSITFSSWTDVRLNSVKNRIWEDITLEQNDTFSSALDLDVMCLDARKNKEGVIDSEQVQEVANRVVSAYHLTPAEALLKYTIYFYNQTDNARKRCYRSKMA